MRTFWIAFITSLLVTVGISKAEATPPSPPVAPAPLEAAGASCPEWYLTESEWDRIEDGLLRSVVADIVGDNGYVTQEPFTAGDYRYMWKGYIRCNGNVSQVGYRDYLGGDAVWRVHNKAR